MLHRRPEDTLLTFTVLCLTKPVNIHPDLTQIQPAEQKVHHESGDHAIARFDQKDLPDQPDIYPV